MGVGVVGGVLLEGEGEEVINYDYYGYDYDLMRILFAVFYDVFCGVSLWWNEARDREYSAMALMSSGNKAIANESKMILPTRR